MAAYEKVRVQTKDFSIEKEVKLLRKSSKKIGAVVTFLGTARDFSEGKNVKAIEFEQYRDMALKALKKLRTDAMKKFKVIDISIVHRVARVKPGDQIVVINAASMHRKDAFLACQWCIDTLKKTVPIWKKEFTPSGESWVTEHP
ncbi:MAG: molybdenum cofactor biosynthesis protein MoaE [Deltaproteobacteria bacterium]|nr:molybdenum cofactor biosynthesis protein MoaE [Deltaproteobacteria bacterium]